MNKLESIIKIPSVFIYAYIAPPSFRASHYRNVELVIEADPPFDNNIYMAPASLLVLPQLIKEQFVIIC